MHFGSNVVAGIGISLATYAYVPAILPCVVIGSIIGTLITPDMDLEGTTYTEKLLRKIPLMGWLWQINWYGYALLYKHRGLSHSFIFGTLGRLLWLLLIILFFMIILAGMLCLLGQIPRMPDLSMYWTVENLVYLLITLLAWMIQDWNHYLLDWLFSEGKRHGRRRNYNVAHRYEAD